jgi:lipoyl(octanoyl) transferase
VTPWRLLPFERLPAAENMAIDEAVLRCSQAGVVQPTLRFYGWRSPAVSLGYFQDSHKDINLDACRRQSFDVIRRPTGGKAVVHDRDWTYSLVAKDNNTLFPRDILGTYRVISRCLVEGLRALGLAAEIVSEGRSLKENPLSASCFSAPSQYELLVQNQKICGSAQVRSKGVLLQHGSLLVAFDPVQTCDVLMWQAMMEKQARIAKLRSVVTSLQEHLPDVPGNEKICRIMKESFETVLGIRLEAGRLTSDEEKLKEDLLKYKYTSKHWNLEGKISHDD